MFKNLLVAVILFFIALPVSANLIRWDLTLTPTSGAPNGAFGLSAMPPEFHGFVTFDLSQGGGGGLIVDFGLTIGDTTWNYSDLNQLGGDSTLTTVGLSLVDDLGTSPIDRNLVITRLSDGSISEWSARDNRGIDESISGVLDVNATYVSESLVNHGLYTTDLLSNLDWLDLTVTNGYSYNDVTDELSSGGSLEGWRYATLNEVISFWIDAGISNIGMSLPGWTESSYSEIKSLTELVGLTIEPPSGSLLPYGTNGFTGTPGGFANSQAGAYIQYRTTSDGINQGRAVINTSPSQDTAVIGLGSWLVRPTTNSEPNVVKAGFQTELFATGLGAITGLTFDSSGTLYATDYLGGRVIRVTDYGSYDVIATGLPFATDLAFTHDGRLFVTSSTGGNSNVYQVGTGGALSVYASGFSYPTSIESVGNDLYVSNSGDGTISKIDAIGNISTFLSGFSAPHGPFGISFDDSDNMYFTDHGTGNVYTSDLLGNVQYLGTIAPLGAIYTLPDNNGNLYVSSSQLASIYEIDSLGDKTLFANNFTGKSSPPVIGPTDMVFDDDGNMFVGDGDSIWKLTLQEQSIEQSVEIDIKPGSDPNSINIKCLSLFPKPIFPKQGAKSQFPN